MNGFFKNVVSVIFGLLLGCGMIYLRCYREKQRERDDTQRMVEAGKWVDAKYNPNRLWIETPQETEDRKALISFTESYLRDVTSDNLSTAYEKTTKAFKEKTSLTEFKEFVRANPAIKSPDECSIIGNLSYVGGSMSVPVGKHTAGSKITTVVNVMVVKQGTMKVNDFTIEPSAKPNQ